MNCNEKGENMNLIDDIKLLKKKRNAVILAHNYQIEDVQNVADYVGDSFYLSKVAQEVEADVIVFCGVHFMAETAYLLAPEKKILLQEINAGCPMADMVDIEGLRRLKEQHPTATVVSYVNTSAEVKAESDVCCTSSNAIKIISQIENDKIIFLPDRNLGNYVAQNFPDKEFILWDGYCITHEKIVPDDVLKVKNKYPQAKFLMHPECNPSVVDMADFTGSTSEIIDYAVNSEDEVFVIGTEMGVLCKLQSLCKNKQFFILHPGLVCPNMKKTNLGSVYDALLNNQHQITIKQEIAEKAIIPLQKMMELGR